jgi:drug/metabolite transporter (DMT)-like permease
MMLVRWRLDGPMVAGAGFALASAVAFGVTTPVIQHFGRGSGPFATASLLYGGAAMTALFPSGKREVHSRAGAFPLKRLAVVVVLGAVVAPALLAWGIQRTSGVIASLLLTLEALFTALFARALWAEPIGTRAGLGLAAITVGGGLLVVQKDSPVATPWGALAVIGATLAWAADNAVGRPLADRDPARVVLAKAALGALASFVLATVVRERLPSAGSAVALAVCGAAGYGGSLRLYLRAQRAIGAARTGSLYSTAPFVGAAAAWAMGQPFGGGPGAWAALALCAAGVWLHLTERHDHAHRHEKVWHDHPHTHDDLHHTHRHDSEPAGEHSHGHWHEPVAHTHPHGLDPHHRHKH